MNERFEINGVEFQCRKLNAFKQFHIVRKIAPILGELIPMAQKFSKLNKDVTDTEQAEGLVPLINGIGNLSDQDAEYVLHGLLSVVDMKQSGVGNWAPVSNGSMLMFANLELPLLLQAAGRAFMFNMTGFFKDLPSISVGKQSKQKTQ